MSKQKAAVVEEYHIEWYDTDGDYHETYISKDMAKQLYELLKAALL